MNDKQGIAIVESLLKILAYILVGIALIWIIIVLQNLADNTKPHPNDLTATPPVAEPSPTAPQNLEPIIIGVAIDRYGKFTAIGKKQFLGCELAQGYYANTKIDGRTILIACEDAGGTEEKTKESFEQFIENGVVAIAGPSVSLLTKSAFPLANLKGVPAMGLATTANNIVNGKDFTYRISASVERMVKPSVSFALGGGKIVDKAIIAFEENNNFTESESQAFESMIHEIAPSIEITSVKFLSTTKEFTTQIEVIGAFQPQLITISGFAENGGRFVKQIRENFSNMTIIGGNGLNTDELFDYCKPYCKDLLISQAYNPESKDQLTIREDFKKLNPGTVPSQFSAQTFAAITVLIQALTNLNQSNPIATMSVEELRKNLNLQLQRTGVYYQTPIGNVHFTDDGDIPDGDLELSIIEADENGDNARFVVIPIK